MNELHKIAEKFARSKGLRARVSQVDPNIESYTINLYNDRRGTVIGYTISKDELFGNAMSKETLINRILEELYHVLITNNK